MDADVGVVGVGSVGSMALWRLRKAGLSAIGFEQFSPGHGLGGAGGETRYFRTAYAEGHEYVPLLLSSYELWSELETAARAEFVWNCGFITIGPQDESRFAGAKACADAAGIVCEILDGREAGARYPQHRYRSDDFVLVDGSGGLYASEYAVACAARVAEEAGATIHRQTRVDRLLPDADGVTILAGDRSFRVGKVVLTTGGWASELLPEVTEVLEPRRTWQSWYFATDPEPFVPERFPPFGRTIDGLRLHGAPTLDRRFVCIGAVEELPETLIEDDYLGRRLLPDMSVVNEYVREYFVGLSPDPVRVMPAVDGYTLDEHALVGLHPNADHVVVLCGFSCHGFKLAPVMGQIAVDLATSGATSHPIEHLRIGRFGGAPDAGGAAVANGDRPPW